MSRHGKGEGSIYRRRDGRYVAAITLQSGHRRYFYGRTRREAYSKYLKARRNLEDGLPLAPERLKVGEYLIRWLEDSVKPTVRPYTLASYATLVRRHIVPELGNLRLGSLTPQDIQGFLNKKREAGLSPRSVQYIHAVLRRALGQAERWGLVPRNVARLVSPPRVPKAEIQPLTPAEAKRFLAAVREDRLEALYTVALAVGLRQGEALGLRWQDVNLAAGTLSVRVSLQREANRYVLAETKTDRSRRTVNCRMCV